MAFDAGHKCQGYVKKTGHVFIIFGLHQKSG